MIPAGVERYLLVEQRGIKALYMDAGLLHLLHLSKTKYYFYDGTW